MAGVVVVNDDCALGMELNVGKGADDAASTARASTANNIVGATKAATTTRGITLLREFAIAFGCGCWLI